MICAVNKVDRLREPEVAEVLADAAELEVVDEVFPISAQARHRPRRRSSSGSRS